MNPGRAGAGRIAVAALIAGILAAFFYFDLGRYFTLDHVRAQQAALSDLYARRPLAVAAAFIAVYATIAMSFLPLAAVTTLAAGAIFGFVAGVVLASFASSLGATLAFLASRYVLKDGVQARFGARLRSLDDGILREGAFYLFALRLVPAVPFALVNLLAGLTSMRAWTFYWVSQAGMLAATLVYVNAGTQIARLDSLSGLVSPALLGSLALLGVFPLVARLALDAARERRAYSRWRRPVKYERNLVVIGAGAAGLVAAYVAAALRAKVTLIEKERMGGDCLNTGCVPSKALVSSARLLAQARRAGEFGIEIPSVRADFAAVMRRVRQVVDAVAPHDSVERYESLGVECLKGTARITSPWTLEISRDGEAARTLSTRAIVVAAGARPFIPPIPGLADLGCLTSDTVWDLRSPPQRLVVLGGGPVGCELAQCFARLGSRVTQVEMLPHLLPREDPEFSEMVAQRFREEGIEVLTGHRAVRSLIRGGEKTLVCERDGTEVSLVFDQVVCALGRVASTTGYGLEELGIPVTPARTIETNEFLQTRYPNILVCGDAAGPYQFTHTAGHTAWYAAVNALFGPLFRLRADFSVVPWATFTDPEVARVGLNEIEARDKGVACEVTRFTLDGLDRAIADGEARGLVKVLTAPGRDRILGVTIAGAHAGDTIAEFVAAMRHGIGLKQVLQTIHIYPTWTEANRHAAAAWRGTHAPARLLDLARRYHAWRRGD